MNALSGYLSGDCVAQDCQLNVYKPNPRQYIASISQVRALLSSLPNHLAPQPHVLYSVIEISSYCCSLVNFLSCRLPFTFACLVHGSAKALGKDDSALVLFTCA